MDEEGEFEKGQRERKDMKIKAPTRGKKKGKKNGQYRIRTGDLSQGASFAECEAKIIPLDQLPYQRLLFNAQSCQDHVSSCQVVCWITKIIINNNNAPF